MCINLTFNNSVHIWTIVIDLMLIILCNVSLEMCIHGDSPWPILATERVDGTCHLMAAVLWI